VGLTTPHHKSLHVTNKHTHTHHCNTNEFLVARTVMPLTVGHYISSAKSEIFLTN